MIDFDDVVGKSRQGHNSHSTQIPDHAYRTLIVGDSVSRKNKCIT